MTDIHEKPRRSYLITTNILLACLLAVLIVIVVLLLKDENGDKNRFSFETHQGTREIYIFDKQTGKLFITSPEVIGDYSGEVWTKLDPTQKGKTLSFKQFLEDTANRKLRKQFIDKQKTSVGTGQDLSVIKEEQGGRR